MTFLAEHQLLVQVLAGLLAASLAPLVAWLALRPRRVAAEGRHRSNLTAEDRPYTPRHVHTVPHLPRLAVGSAGPVALGHTPGGDLALMDDTYELVSA